MNAKLLFILGIIAIGLGFLFQTQGFANFSDLLMWWPSLIILMIGVLWLIGSEFRVRFLPLALIAIGAFIHAGELGLDLYWGSYWPVILIVGGVWWLIGSRFSVRFLPLALPLIAIGAFLQTLVLGLDRHWPIILIVVGIVIITSGISKLRQDQTPPKWASR